LTHDILCNHPKILEMGHIISKKSGEPECVVFQSAWLNQLDRLTVEGVPGFQYLENVVVDIGGIGVELRTAQDWVRAGFLPQAILDAAPVIEF
jgi:hypothetical protein